MATVGSIQVADILTAFSALGADATAIRRAAGLSADVLEDPAARVPSEPALRLFTLAAAALNDPVVGLHAGLRAQARGPLFYLLMSGPDARAAMRSFARFARIALDSLDVRFVERAGHAELTFDPTEPELRASHHVVDYLVATNLMSIRRTNSSFRLLGVDLAHAEAGVPGETARALGCPVRFGRRVSALRMSLASLAGRPLAANHLIAEQLEKLSHALLANLTTASARERVASLVRRILAAGAVPQRRDVAKHLHVSERTLQRQLEDEGTTFKEVRDGVRTELSRAMLSDRSMKVEAVAHSVGYAEVASFSKAFTRWSGRSPTTFRSSIGERQQPRRPR